MKYRVIVPIILALLLAACGAAEEEGRPNLDIEETIAVAVAETVAAHSPPPTADSTEPTPYPTYTPWPTYTPFPTPALSLLATDPPSPEVPEAEETLPVTVAPDTGPTAETLPELTLVTARTVITAVRAADGATMVYVPAGEFLMGASDADLALVGASGPPPLAGGDEQPQHPVTVDAFWIDQTEVTNAQYSNFVNLTGYKTVAEIETFSFTDGEQVTGVTFYHPQGRESGIDDKMDHPVVQVAWEDANAYCRWVDARLPTEAEWEKAAKGTANDRLYPWGNSFPLVEAGAETPPPAVANFCDASCPYVESRYEGLDDGYARTAPVGSFPTGASPYGALDMAGNVWEWVAGTYEGYPGTTYELAEEFGDYFRVVRGGSWDNAPPILRVTFRQNNPPRTRSDGTGFRCAVSDGAFETAASQSPTIEASPDTAAQPATETVPEPDQPTPVPTTEPVEAEATSDPSPEPAQGVITATLTVEPTAENTLQ